MLGWARAKIGQIRNKHCFIFAIFSTKDFFGPKNGLIFQFLAKH